MWPESEIRAREDARMPAMTSAIMKATISAKAPASRLESASAWAREWSCATALITAVRQDPGPKKARDPGQGGVARADERGISKVSSSLVAGKRPGVNIRIHRIRHLCAICL